MIMECYDTVWINCVEDVLGHGCNLYNTSSQQFTQPDEAGYITSERVSMTILIFSKKGSV